MNVFWFKKKVTRVRPIPGLARVVAYGMGSTGCFLGHSVALARELPSTVISLHSEIFNIKQNKQVTSNFKSGDKKKYIFLNRWLEVPKKDSSKSRLVLDASRLNKFIQPYRVKLVSVSSTYDDLKDALWHIPIHSWFRSFLGVSIGKKPSQFCVLPFGLNVATRVFPKLWEANLYNEKLKYLMYINDWLINGQPEESKRVLSHTTGGCINEFTLLSTEIPPRTNNVVTMAWALMDQSPWVQWFDKSAGRNCSEILCQPISVANGKVLRGH